MTLPDDLRQQVLRDDGASLQTLRLMNDAADEIERLALASQPQWRPSLLLLIALLLSSSLLLLALLAKMNFWVVSESLSGTQRTPAKLDGGWGKRDTSIDTSIHQ
jgi:hypothetical protein